MQIIYKYKSKQNNKNFVIFSKFEVIVFSNLSFDFLKRKEKDKKSRKRKRKRLIMRMEKNQLNYFKAFD